MTDTTTPLVPPTRAMRSVLAIAVANGWTVTKQQRGADADWQWVRVEKDIPVVGTVQMDANWEDGKITGLYSNVVGTRVLGKVRLMRHFREMLADPFAGYETARP